MSTSGFLWLVLLAGVLPNPTMAQTNPTAAYRWFAAAPAVPDFQVPKSRAAWERRSAAPRPCA